MQAFPDAFKTEEPFPHFSPRETLAYAHACGTPAQEKWGPQLDPYQLCAQVAKERREQRTH